MTLISYTSAADSRPATLWNICWGKSNLGVVDTRDAIESCESEEQLLRTLGAISSHDFHVLRRNGKRIVLAENGPTGRSCLMTVSL